MIKIFQDLALAICFVCVSALASAGQSELASDDLVHEELRQLKTDMQDALNEMDIDKKLARVTEDAVFTTMNGDRVVGRDGIRKYFEKMLKGANPIVKEVSVDFSVDELSHLYGDNTAVAFGSSRDKYLLSDGYAFEVEPKWSATMVRQGDKWLVANFHYSTNMFDNPVLTAQRKMLFIGGSVVSLLLGLAGFFLAKRIYKR